MAVRRKAISAINKSGALLVFPLNNRKEPLSIWSSLYPRTKMKWEWDVDGDQKVSDLWVLRENLSRSREVIYSKWYQGRATFFSKELFRCLLRFLDADVFLTSLRSSSSQLILETLEMDSPLSTKQLKEATELQGRLLESEYSRALKPLWERLLIVGYGEMDDSSFPSLLVGASKNIFEDLWQESLEMPIDKARREVLRILGDQNPFYKFAMKVKSKNFSTNYRGRH